MHTYFEVKPIRPFDPTAVVMGGAENDADSLLFDEGALPPEFFDLSSGLAGELLHRLSIYQMRLAAVVPDLTIYSAHFQAFALEANKGEQFRFFLTRQEAILWLEQV
ncbi:MAG: DUF4180 domain-containing protein [Anaerolineae bacterium]|nr:DUF4180 domain-containing protein [Anaerolineae bacterium]